MSVRLVAAGTADLDAVLEVMGVAFDPRFGEAWSASQLTGSMTQPDSWARLARDGNMTIGFSLCRRIVDEAELLLVAVVPAARAQGIGAMLIDAAAADARARGVITMFLEMRDGNHAAARLYQRRGFTEIGRRRDYYRGSDGGRFDAVTMRRNLNV